jgi:hypothetical protein
VDQAAKGVEAWTDGADGEDVASGTDEEGGREVDGVGRGGVTRDVEVLEEEVAYA